MYSPLVPYFGPTTQFLQNAEPAADSQANSDGGGNCGNCIDYSNRVNPETKLIRELF